MGQKSRRPSWIKAIAVVFFLTYAAFAFIDLDLFWVTGSDVSTRSLFLTVWGIVVGAYLTYPGHEWR